MRNSVDITYPASGSARLAARRRRRGLLVLAIVIVAGLAWLWRPLGTRALTATSYAARIACSCHYIGGRALADCRKDLLPGMGLVMLSADEEGKSVTARLLPLSSQSAFYRQGPGCVLETTDP